LGVKSREGNISVEMCSREFFLKHVVASRMARIRATQKIQSCFVLCVVQTIVVQGGVCVLFASYNSISAFNFESFNTLRLILSEF